MTIGRMAERASVVEVRGLRVEYAEGSRPVPALQGVDLTLPAGRITTLIGPSGCGKSTLLLTLAGLVSPSAGQVAVGGEEVRPGRPGTSLILQEYGLLPWKTVEENVALGLRLRGLGAPRWRPLVQQALEEMGLWELRRRYPARLSGGQRQRVAIARALALEPDLLLMDEPFSSLDALTREGLQETLLYTWRRLGPTVALVTHSIEEAVYLGGEIVVFSPGPGRVTARFDNPGAGDPDYRSRPAFYSLCARVRAALEGGARDG